MDNIFVVLEGLALVMALVATPILYYVPQNKVGLGLDLRQVASWALSFIAVFVLGKTGLLAALAGAPTWQLLLFGLGVGLQSNGIFKIPAIKTLINEINKILDLLNGRA